MTEIEKVDDNKNKKKVNFNEEVDFQAFPGKKDEEFKGDDEDNETYTLPFSFLKRKLGPNGEIE